MPSPGLSEMPSFATSQEFPDSPSASSPSSTIGGQSNNNLQATFYERLTGLPLVRAGVARVKDVYRSTKDRHELIRAALEAGEDTVHASMSRAAGLLHKSGLSERLQGPRKSCVIVFFAACLTSRSVRSVSTWTLTLGPVARLFDAFLSLFCRVAFRVWHWAKDNWKLINDFPSSLSFSVSLAESSACFVLDKVEANLPIITKSPYEVRVFPPVFHKYNVFIIFRNYFGEEFTP